MWGGRGRSPTIIIFKEGDKSFNYNYIYIYIYLHTLRRIYTYIYIHTHIQPNITRWEIHNHVFLVAFQFLLF